MQRLYYTLRATYKIISFNISDNNADKPKKNVASKSSFETTFSFIKVFWLVSVKQRKTESHIDLEITCRFFQGINDWIFHWNQIAGNRQEYFLQYYLFVYIQDEFRMLDFLLFPLIYDKYHA